MSSSIQHYKRKEDLTKTSTKVRFERRPWPIAEDSQAPFSQNIFGYASGDEQEK
jgi:hypothetical protein